MGKKLCLQVSHSIGREVVGRMVVVKFSLVELDESV
jgi:hypothetical protein